jgi:signal transduction histidine kinase
VNEQGVLIFPPTRRDGEVTSQILGRAGLSCTVCHDAGAVASEINAGMGALIMTDAALAAPGIQSLLTTLSNQPAWSDLPVVLLSQMGPQTTAVANILRALTNVIVLDRPTSARTLISTVQAALRGRLRQYQIRDQLEALRIAEESLRNADRRKDEFLAMLAHELRNPLAPIRNAGELLTRLMRENPEVETLAAIVQRQSAHLTRLVDDLLDVSRITRGRIELQREPVNLNSVVAHALEMVEPIMREHRHELSVMQAPDSVYVSGDHARLVQCITNILANAGKYTDVGGAISIQLRTEGEEAVLTVTDNGVGIPDELLPRIFDLFVQNNRSLDRSQGGLGIGLSVVRRLVEMHGGRVSAASNGPGTGSRFEVRLPVIAPPAQQQEISLKQGTVKHRILVVDDNADSADSLAMILTISGHEAQPVYTASEALVRAADYDPDVILLDIGLPDIDGYEVARRLKGRGSHARLIAVTGYGRPEDIRRAQSAGFDSHLVKPIDPQRLLRNLD